MKTDKRVSIIGLLTALTVTVPLAAQTHHHYKLIDLGTFGGPNSSTQDELQVLNSQGMIAGKADASIPNHPNACLFCSSSFISHAFQWRNGILHDLGALPGANSSGANWIADSGLTAGFSETDETDPSPFLPGPLVGIRQMHAVLWKDGHITDLGTLEGGYESVAFAVNSRGQVAGGGFNTVPDPFSFLGTQQRVFLWQNGVMEDLGTLGGPDAGLVGSFKGNVEMNESGQVVACSYTNSTVNPITGTPTVDPFLWENGAMIDIGTLGGTSGCAVYLNNRGQVVGYSNVAGDLTFHPFLWERGIMKDLGTLGGTFGFANWINDAGEVTGGATILGDRALHAFSWKNGIMTDLGTLPGDVVSQPQAVNSRGQVVGASSQTPDFTANRAFLWESGGPMVDLNALVISGLGVQLLSAVDINNRGEIDAVGVLPTGDTHAILLIPCDENHPDVEGCDYSSVRVSPASAGPAPHEAPRPAMPAMLWGRNNRSYFPTLSPKR